MMVDGSEKTGCYVKIFSKRMGRGKLDEAKYLKTFYGGLWPVKPMKKT